MEEEGKMSVRWETEGLQTVGIVCLVIMFLKLMHLLGLIDITETGEVPEKEVRMRKKRRTFSKDTGAKYCLLKSEY